MGQLPEFNTENEDFSQSAQSDKTCCKKAFANSQSMSIANKVNFFAKLRSVFFSYFSCMYNEGKVLGVEFL